MKAVSSAEGLATDQDRSQLWLAESTMLAVALIWGMNIPVMKFALARVDPHIFNATRLLISAAVLGGIVLWNRTPILDRRRGARSTKYQIGLILLFSVMIGFAYQVLFLVGIDLTTSGSAALILSAIPMWTAILGYLLMRERLAARAWLGLMIAFMGTLLVTFNVPGNTIAGSSLTGNLIVSAAAFSWALASVLSRPMMNSISPLALAFCGVSIAVPLHYLVASPSISQLDRFVIDPWLAASVIFSGAFSTGLAYAMWNHGVKRLGTSQAAIFQNLVPFIALLVGWPLLGEIPAWLQVTGGLIIVFGLFVMRTDRMRHVPPPTIQSDDETESHRK